VIPSSPQRGRSPVISSSPRLSPLPPPPLLSPIASPVQSIPSSVPHPSTDPDHLQSGFQRVNIFSLRVRPHSSAYCIGICLLLIPNTCMGFFVLFPPSFCNSLPLCDFPRRRRPECPPKSSCLVQVINALEFPPPAPLPSRVFPS